MLFRSVPVEAVRRVNELATCGLAPHLTFLLDLDPAQAMRRWNRALDRVESRGETFYRRVREGYLRIAQACPERVRVIDASLPPEEVEAQILQHLAQEGVALEGGALSR